MVIFFYNFALLMIASSLMVITSRNPVHSVLWLIFAFINASGLMVLIGAEFLAMMLIIIYVGAVSVLFLFVVMTLDIKFSEFKGKLKSDLILSVIIAIFMFIDLIVIILLSTNTIQKVDFGILHWNSKIDTVYQIGNLLYTRYILPFQTAGLILFVAMIASITLTIRHRIGVKRQDVSLQLARNKKNSVSLARVEFNKGIDELNYEAVD